MKRPTRPIFTGLLLVALAVAVPTVAAGEEAIVLVVNADNPVTKIGRRELKRLLSGKTTHWASGTPVTIVLLPKDSDEMAWLSDEILGMPEEAYRRHLLQQVFRGRITKPKKADGAAQARKMVVAHQGAIAPLRRTEVTEGVHVLEVE